MKTLIIDNGSSLLPKLEKLFLGNIVVKGFNEINTDDLVVFDLFVLSGGGKHNVIFDEDKFKNEEKIILSGKPVIGICFGCELIARTFGGELIELPEERKGIFGVEILDKSFGNGILNVYESHRWSISKLPDVFEVIAKSETGPEIIRHKYMPIYGLQFHPENMLDETEGSDILNKIVSSLSLV